MICSQCGNIVPPEKQITIKGKEDWCYDCYKTSPKNICVDFDGVLAQYSGWKGSEHMGEPMPGAKEFLDQLNAKGYVIYIHSTRSPSSIISWVQKYGLAKDYFVRATNEKIAAVAYIDDRAILFRGSFSDALTDLQNFKPHWKE